MDQAIYNEMFCSNYKDKRIGYAIFDIILDGSQYSEWNYYRFKYKNFTKRHYFICG